MSDSFYYPSAGEDRYFAKLQEILSKYPHNPRHLLDNFPVYASRRSYIRQIVYYELFKHTVDLPGHYADFGVYYAKSYFTWHKLIETLIPTATHKKVIGFDTFGGFPNLDEKDGPESSGVQKRIGGLSSASFRDEFEELLRLHNEDGVIPSSRGSIIVGDISDTLPAFLNENQETMFCLINLDVDIYEPTKLVLDLCWDRLVKGGVLILDEYATSKWPGETIAWNEFAQERGIMTKLQRFNFANAPGAYMIKE